MIATPPMEAATTMMTVRAVFFFARALPLGGGTAEVSAGASTSEVSVTLACSIAVAGAEVVVTDSVVCDTIDDEVEDSLVVEESEDEVTPRGISIVDGVASAPEDKLGSTEASAAVVVSSLGNEGEGAAPPTGGSSTAPGPS